MLRQGIVALAKLSLEIILLNSSKHQGAVGTCSSPSSAVFTSSMAGNHEKMDSHHSSNQQCSSSASEEATSHHSRNLVTDFVRVRDLKPLPGDLIEFNRDMYSHWALYVGEGNVIHVRGGQADSEVSFTGRANVRMDPLSFVAGGSLVRINNQESQAAEKGLGPLPVESLVENARKLVGTQVQYDLFKKNCEHYVTEWRYGIPWSDQVK